MTESNDKDLKKVHLIKQPRQDSPEQPQEMSAQNPLDPGRRKKEGCCGGKEKNNHHKESSGKSNDPRNS